MKLFGTDGIRDIFGQGNMTLEMGERFGRALVLFCQKRSWPLKIMVGRDTRESGAALEESVVAGIVAAGGEAVTAGVIPTPGLAFLVRDQQAGAGIVISASHNPFGYNGLKPFKNDGTKLTDEEEAEMEKYILEKNDQIFNSGSSRGLPDARERYANFILENLPFDFKDPGLEVILDCANGATFEAAPMVFEKIARRLEIIADRPDGKNINAHCGSQHPDSLRKAVLEKKADLGLAFDGDGDRVIVVDEKGNVLTGDQMIFIIAKMLKERGALRNDLVVTTVMSNLGFIEGLKELGIRHIAAAVGDRPVFFAMQENGSVLGGEESGHIIFADYLPTGDGMMAGMLLLAARIHFQRPLSELAKEIKLFPKVLINVEVKAKPDLGTIPEISEIIKRVEDSMGSSGRILVRYSGTENLCRIMIEGKKEEEVRRDAELIASAVKKHLG